VPEAPPPLWRTLSRAAIPVGMVCVLLGFAVRNILAGATLASAPALGPTIVGLALIAGGVALNLRWIRETVSRRRFLVGLNVWAMVVLSGILLVVVNTIVVMTPQTESWRLDCTRQRIHTLSEKTMNVLNGLKDEARITVLIGSGKASFGRRGEVDISQRVQDMAALYRASSGRVRTEVIRHYRERLRAEKVASRIHSQVTPDSVVVECGDRYRAIPFRELVDLPGVTSDGAEGALPGFLGEEKITAAIVQVTEPDRAAVYFTTGHGEPALAGPSANAMNELVAALKRDNYRVEPLNLLQRRAVPADCRALVIAGPASPFDEQETEILHEYLAGNGQLLVLVRAKQPRVNLGALYTLLKEYNVRVEQDRTVIEVYRDPVTGVRVGNLLVVVRDYGKHPVTEGLKGTNCVIQSVYPISTLLPEPKGVVLGAPPKLASPYRVTTLMRSGPDSWGETDLKAKKVKFDKGEDEKGPLPIAVAVERRRGAGGPRMVVIGAVSIANDEAIRKYAGNRTLLLNSIAWLAKKETKLGIPPQRPHRRALNASRAGWNVVFVITVIGMPLAAALIGAAVWWVRRRG